MTYIPRRRDIAIMSGEAIDRMGGATEWVRRIAALLAEGTNLDDVNRYKNNLFQGLATYEPKLLSEILRALRALRKSIRALLILILALIIAAYLRLIALGRGYRPHSTPRPVRSIVRPRPPTAPLAPPM